MRLGKFIWELFKILIRRGPSIQVLFDTEAALYLVHVVPIDSVAAEIDPTEDGKKRVVILFTKQEEARRHLREPDMKENRRDDLSEAIMRNRIIMRGIRRAKQEMKNGKYAEVK